MELLTHIREAFINLKSSKMRSFLAILGVLVGTGSVVALISSSQLATNSALAQFKTLGTNLLAVNLQQPQGKQSQQQNSLTMKEMPEIISASPQIRVTAPYINVYKPINFKGKALFGQVIGAYEQFSDIAKLQLSRGRFVTILDKNNLYCMVGAKIAKEIQQQNVNPIGQQILIGNSFFTIVGVLKPWPQNLFIYADINNSIIVPLNMAYYLDSKAAIDDLLFRLIKDPNLNQAQAAVVARIKQILPGVQVQPRNPQQIINVVAKQRETLNLLLVAIGSISLIVGGIGVMNIMLVSVVERRREIGIRMAIGAQPKDIMLMFLVESVILTLFGGVLGVLCGVVASFVLAYLNKWTFVFYLLPPALGFLVSVFVGMVSGIYPAIRASRLDPIKTLTED